MSKKRSIGDLENRYSIQFLTREKKYLERAEIFIMNNL